MSSDRPTGGPSPEAEPGAPAELAATVRERGAVLLEALEEHLPGARDHADATGSYAFAAAVVGLELPRAEAELVRETARLHDVGMLYVPAEVARTPWSELDEAGRQAFEGHYEAGARLALGAGIPDDVCGWLLQLRERWDGRGPERLAGDAIPLPARVARAACGCDLALATAAPGATRAERRTAAATALRAAAGHELDPRLAEALAGILEREPA